MTDTAPFPGMGAAPELEAAAAHCLEHLKREEVALNRCCDALQQVRQALRGNHGDELLTAIETQEQTEKQLCGMQTERTRLTNRLAVTLDVPASLATVGRLLRCVEGGQRLELQRARRQVRRASKAVERLCRGNAALIAHRMEMIRRLLYAFGAINTGAYQKTGQVDLSANVATKERYC